MVKCTLLTVLVYWCCTVLQCSLMDLSDLVELFLAGNPFCTEHGNYHKVLHEVIPHLEMLDGVGAPTHNVHSMLDTWGVK